MAQPSSSDVTAPFDPTAYASLSFAQLMQLVSGLVPYTDKGLIVTTTDVAGVPEVPNAAVTTKWKTYLWRRITATTTNVYVWDDNQVSDATYLKWVSINVAGIAVGSVVNAMIADNTITDVKIANLDYSKLLNVPTGLPPSGAAGGDLTGTYPNPSIGNAKVTGSQMALATITHANIGADAVEVETDVKPSAVGLSIVRTNAGATAIEHAVAKITEVANPTAGDTLKVVRVNAGETAFEKSTIQTIISAAQYTSAEFTPVQGPVADVAHGLGGLPTYTRWVLVCKSAELDYSVNDEIDIVASVSNVSANYQTYIFGASATNMFLILNGTLGAPPAIWILHKTTGTSTQIDTTKWKLKGYARIA